MTNPKQQAAAPEINEANMGAVMEQAAKGGDLSDGDFKALLQLMMLKEKRLIVKEAAAEQVLAAQDKQSRENSLQYAAAKMETQKNCRHLKGGKSRQRGQQKDPAVYAHTFTDGTTVIKCQLCSAKWTPKDTAEWYTRGTVKVKNWTGIGWREALEMAGESSNRPSSSERFFIGQDTSQKPETETGEVPVNLQF